MKEGDADLRKIGASRVFRESGLDRLWAEFSKTLHVQHLDSGGKIEKRARLTVPARAYFSVSAVIEGPLGDTIPTSIAQASLPLKCWLIWFP